MSDVEFADLSRFFAPNAIALVGATDDNKKYAGRCLERMIGFKPTAPIYPINPKYSSVMGLPCFANVGSTPEIPDHVGIMLPAPAVLPALEECAAAGVRFATVFTSGFGEIATEEGQARDRQLRALAKRTGLRFMGPNCNGWVNFTRGVSLTPTITIADGPRPGGDIGVVAHSGGVGQVNTMWRAQKLGLEISIQASCGNDADIDALDIMNYMVEDESTQVIMAVLETIRDGGKLFELARRAAEREKPIVVLKLGRTEDGSRSAMLHTGAITGSDDIHDAAFRQAGIIRVTDTHELYETAMLLRRKRWARRPNVAALSVSGGNVGLLADLGAMAGLSWPDYAPQTKDRIAALIPGFAAHNPTDLTTAGMGSPQTFGAVLDAMAADPNIDMIVPISTSPGRGDVDAVAAFAKRETKAVAFLWTGEARGGEPVTQADVIADGVAVYENVSNCVNALKRLADYSAFLQGFKAGAGRAAGRALERPANIDSAKAREIIRDKRGVLPERISKQILGCYGFPVTQEGIAGNAAEAVEMAKAFAAPVALKIESADIPHKSEAKAIRLNVTADSAAKSFDEVMQAARAFSPDARLDGVLVQEMVAPGVEVIAGVTADPIFGPVVVVGLGGILVEVLKDVAYCIAPFDHAQARAMLAGLRGAKLLKGVRGAPPCDEAALCDLLVRLSWLAVDLRGKISELDINPIVVFETGRGAKVVDAAIVLSPGQD